MRSPSLMGSAPLLPDTKTLPLEELVAQMIVVRASGYLFDHQIQYPKWEPPAATLQHWIKQLGVGGVILLGGSAAELSLRSQQLQHWAKYPLLIAADIEEGVGQRFSGATWFPPPMAIGAIALQNLDKALNYAALMGEVVASEALAIGINWVLAPVVDVNNNPVNPVINVRSFGDNPDLVGKLATAFIQGAQKYPVLTTAKHFPGHGDTATDSHLDLPILPHSPPRLAEIELPPFVRAIAAGVDAIMSAHLLIPAWDSERPATLSHKVLTELLRDSLHFDGLVVTDALVMGAIANRYGIEEAPVLAVEAGADILLMPLDPPGAVQAVCEAVRSGRIPLERIQASVERIRKAKQKLFTDRESVGEFAKEITPDPQIDRLAQPPALAAAYNICQDSLVVGGLPLSSDSLEGGRGLRNLIVVDRVLGCDFLDRQAPAIAFPQQLGYKLQLIDQSTFNFSEDLNPELTLLQLFVRGNPFRGSAGIATLTEDLFKRLLKTNSLQALVIYGSPYVLPQFLRSLPSQTPYVFSYGQMPVAQAIALEVLFGFQSVATLC